MRRAEYIPGFDEVLDQMQVACWCATAMVWLPRHLVGVTTRSCGREGCKEPRR